MWEYEFESEIEHVMPRQWWVWYEIKCDEVKIKPSENDLVTSQKENLRIRSNEKEKYENPLKQETL